MLINYFNQSFEYEYPVIIYIGGKTMFVSLLANIGIILINMYIIWKIKASSAFSKMKPVWQVVAFILIETVVGFLLLNFSFVILDTHLDFRAALFALGMKYLGEKVTLPVIFLVGIGRIFHSGTLHGVLNMLIVLIVLLTFNQVYNWSKRHFSDIGQILVLNAYYTLVAFPFGTYLLKDFWKSLIVYTVLFIFTTIVIILIYQVTEDVEQLLNRATFDSLTTLYNSQKFREDLDKFSFTDVSYAMLVVDVDNFKDYNDKYGHLVGDKVIREIGNQLAKMHQEDHTFYRYGGEEFVILIEDCSGEKATRLANEIHQLIGDLRIPIENGEVLEVTVSIGVAHRINKESLLTTFKRADKALYVAKENGKNQIIIH